MSQAIIDAINKMDPDNDNHWTVDGLAKLDTIKFLNGGVAVTREELDAAAPGFNREALRAYRASLAQGGVNAPATATATGTGAAGGSGGVGSAPPAPPPPAAEPVVEQQSGSPSGEAQVEALAAAIDREKQAIVELQRVQEQARKDIVAAEARMDEAQIKLNELSPPEDNQTTIQRYLARQIEEGQKRGAIRQQIKDSGLDLKDVLKMAGSSPLDEAMRNRKK